MTVPAVSLVETRQRARDEMERTLRLLHPGGGPWEVRAPKTPGMGTVSGYYTDATQCARDVVAQLDGRADGVYVTINPVQQAVAARAAGRLKTYAKHTTKDSEIVRRQRLLIDFDSVRPAGISATDAEHDIALHRARQCIARLAGWSWPAPVLADSGNGAHVLYTVDLPNDHETRQLIERLLKLLAATFGDAVVQVDTSVGNAAQMCKLYGTAVRKGDTSPARPHRRAKLLAAPDELQIVTREQVKMACELLESEVREANRSETGYTNGTNARLVNRAHGQGWIDDVPVWLDRLGVDYREKSPSGGTRRYEIRICPWNDHGEWKCVILWDAGGRVSAACVHADCTGRALRDFRDALEPGWRSQRATPRQKADPPPEKARAQAPITAEMVWDDPLPLPEGMPNVDALDMHLVPVPLRGWLHDIAERMQIPADYVAAGAIVVAGALVGRRIGIYPKRHDDWLVVPNLWGAIVAPPSQMKSPALAEVLKPLDRLAAEAVEKYNAECADFEANAMVAEARKAAIQEQMKKAAKAGHDEELQVLAAEARELVRTKPKLHRYKTNDGTVEKIGEILLENPDGLLVYRDELSGWLRTLDKQGHEGDRAFFLEGWIGLNGHDVDRITRGTLHIPALCLSLLGGIQPGPLSRYVYAATAEESAGNDGLLQRFQLLVWPNPPATWRNVDRWRNTEARNRAYSVLRGLADLTPERCGATRPEDEPDAIPALRFATAAQAVFDEWREQLEMRLRSSEMPAALAAHLAKYRSLMPSLALLFHLMDVADSSVSDESGVGIIAAQTAAAWCEYLESHARRLYASAINPGVERATALLKRLKHGDVADGSTIRDIYVRGWEYLQTKEEAEDAVETLEAYGWVRVEQREAGPKGGRPTKIIHVHPSLCSASAQGDDDGDN